MPFAWLRHAVPWDSGRGSGTLSHGKGSAQRARLEFRRFARPLARSLARSFARSLARRPRRSGFTSSGWSERRGSDPSTHPAHGIHSRWILCACEISPCSARLPLFYFRPSSSRGRPRNITRSRHSFFTVDRRRGPRDNNGGEERFATAITLTATGREVEDTPPSLPAPPFVLQSVPLARSPRGWQKRVGLAG